MSDREKLARSPDAAFAAGLDRELANYLARWAPSCRWPSPQRLHSPASESHDVSSLEFVPDRRAYLPLSETVNVWPGLPTLTHGVAAVENPVGPGDRMSYRTEPERHQRANLAYGDQSTGQRLLDQRIGIDLTPARSTGVASLYWHIICSHRSENMLSLASGFSGWARISSSSTSTPQPGFVGIA